MMIHSHRIAGAVALAAAAVVAVVAATAPAVAAQPRELLVRGGEVVTAEGRRMADVRVVGETVAEIGPALEAGDGAEVIDAGGLLVLPGGIDPHVHLGALASTTTRAGRRRRWPAASRPSPTSAASGTARRPPRRWRGPPPRSAPRRSPR